MNLYLAGRVGVKVTLPSSKWVAGRGRSGDWRFDLVDCYSWDEVSQISIKLAPKWSYVGPFFLECECGMCNHCKSDCRENPHRGCNACESWGTKVQQSHIFNKSLQGIKRADLVIAYAGDDFAEAHGTHVELGYAKALNKKVIILDDMTDNDDLWFVYKSATMVVKRQKEVSIADNVLNILNLFGGK